ncbi:MAG: sulfatase [Chitinophagaceae bacterium]|nr:MAG: sulfatase [Chitinophagaceae bacterium]
MFDHFLLHNYMPMLLKPVKFVIFFSVLILICSAICTAQNKNQTKPNIIFILTDDLGYGDVGVFFQNQRQLAKDHSKPFELTPQIDKMAKDGMQFTNQYANAPVCAPSRASFLTGIHQGNAQVRNNQFDKALENNYTVASILKTAGYTTAAIGKWGLQGVKEEAPYWPAHPLKRGFDYFFGYMRHMDGHEHYPKEGLYRGAKQVWENYKDIAQDLDKCYTTDLWTAKAKQWIIQHQNKNSQQPFFMFLAYDAPHAVLELPTKAYPSGAGLNGGMQWLNQPGKMINTASGTIDSYINPEFANATYDDDNNASTAEKKWPNVYKRYATANKRIDDGVGDILQLLKDLKIDENTLVVFTSDNGSSIESYLPESFLPTFFGSNGPFDGIKRDCWEGGLRVPTIAYWNKNIQAGQITNSPSILSDWMATFTDLAKLPTPARVDGVSLLPTLLKKGNQQNSKIYVEYFESGNTPGFKEFDPSHRNRKRNQMQMLRIGDFVGVRYNIQSAKDSFEIYNVKKDPKQTHNLAQLPSFNKMQQQFLAKALQMRSTDHEAKRPYDQALIPASTISKKLRKGIQWKYFPGEYNYTSFKENQFSSSKGFALNFNKPKAITKNGLIIYDGFIQILEDGQYDFSFSTNEKAFVRLHDAHLFDADFAYEPNQVLTKSVYLKKGFHPIKMSILHHSNQVDPIQFLFKKSSEKNYQNIQVLLYTK